MLNKDALEINNGFLALPKGPGLGIEIDEKKVQEQAVYPHQWRNPTWNTQDGAIAEW